MDLPTSNQIKAKNEINFQKEICQLVLIFFSILMKLFMFCNL